MYIPLKELSEVRFSLDTGDAFEMFRDSGMLDSFQTYNINCYRQVNYRGIIGTDRTWGSWVVDYAGTA